QPRDTLYTGRLASAVGSNDAEDLSFTYGKGDVVDSKQVSVPLDEVLHRNNLRRIHSASPPDRLRSASVYACSAARPRIGGATLVVDLMNLPPPPSARDRRPVADLGAATGQHVWASCPHR